MKLQLGTNLGFAINKYIEPLEWARIVGAQMGLSHVQFVADLLNPALPTDYVDAQIGKIKDACAEFGISVDSIFTSAFTRVNHLLHPEEEMRAYWLDWFKKLLTIGGKLGAKTGGSHFGILTFASYEDEKRREFLVEQGVKGWQKLTIFAQELGYDALIFEPMSVPREMANTIEETIELMERVNANCGVPMRVCLDVGHAPDERQRDPYPWIERLGAVSPIIHLQQTQLHKSHHWPFIEEYNKGGLIQPQKVLDSLQKSHCEEALLLFEISHREHRDTDGRIVADLVESANFWKPYLKDYAK